MIILSKFLSKFVLKLRKDEQNSDEFMIIPIKNPSMVDLESGFTKNNVCFLSSQTNPYIGSNSYHVRSIEIIRVRPSLNALSCFVSPVRRGGLSRKDILSVRNDFLLSLNLKSPTPLKLGFFILAPQRGLEPRTRWLTAICSTD
jgi:uncharacterized Fe-S cluster-containing radical SAM superfamily enzyme